MRGSLENVAENARRDGKRGVPHTATRVAPLVSSHPQPVSLSRYLGTLSVGLMVGEPVRIRRVRPREYGLLSFLLAALAAPVTFPLAMLRAIAEAIEEEAAEERARNEIERE